jgi:hypothetical protein
MLFSPFDFALDVPERFFEVLLGAVVLEVGAPDVFDGVAEVEAHVFGDLDTLDAGWVRCVVLWLVDLVGVVESDSFFVFVSRFLEFFAKQSFWWAVPTLLSLVDMCFSDLLLPLFLRCSPLGFAGRATSSRVPAARCFE